METIIGTETEKDVEIRLIHPLFRKVLGYPESDLEWAKPVPITFGHETRTKYADLIVNHDHSPVIAVEAKRPTETVQSGISQVDSYAFAMKTPFSLVTNGRHLVLRGYYSFNSRINVVDESVENLERSNWDKLINLVSFKNIISAIKEPENPVVSPDEEKIKDYRRFFRKIHNEIRDRDKLDPAAAFDELSKLLFLKAAEDEWRLHSPTKPVLTSQKIAEWESLGRDTAKRLVNEWFNSATSELFPDVFDDHPRIELSPDTLRAVLEMMRPFHVKNGDVDVKGRAFEEFLPSQLRGKGLGQFFTPRPIVNFMADLAGISIQDTVVDFSCGSGGFLIKAFEQMKRGVEQLPNGTLRRLGTGRDAMLNDVKSKQIFGVDAEPRAARTAKMNMLMWGDGKQVVRGNALDTKDFSGKPYEPKEYTETDPNSGCTLILANPPFGSKEKESTILRRYLLAARERQRGPERTEVLFIEKGLKLLKPEGRMLIVLPQGLMSTVKNARIRDYIQAEAEIRAIISLPPHTFTPSGVPMVNTCVLYIQKFTVEKKKLYDTKTFGLSENKIRDLLRTDPVFDYPIFMGIAENIGYKPSGRVAIDLGQETDLDLLLKDFNDPITSSKPDTDVFRLANERYGDRAFLEDESSSVSPAPLKASFTINLSETIDRLDPPYYLLHRQARSLLDSLKPLGETIQEKKKKFQPLTDAELDAEYDILSVSNDGLVTRNKRAKGENFTKMKQVRAGDIAYNPMRINIGSIGVVPKALEGGLVSPDYVVFRSTGLDPDFLVALLRSPFYRMYIDVMTTGSIRDRLYFGNLQAIRVPEVSESEQATICALAGRADEAYETLRKLAMERAGTIDRMNSIIRADSSKSIIDPTESIFYRHVERWKKETAHFSNLRKIIRHPAYQAIVEMGQPVIPYLLTALKKEPDWAWALHAITGQNPVREGEPGGLEAIVRAWTDWGRERGYDV